MLLVRIDVVEGRSERELIELVDVVQEVRVPAGYPFHGDTARILNR